MTDIGLTDSDDLDFDGTDLVIVTGREAVLQHIRMRLGAIRGEWFEDSQSGLPWTTQILGKGVDLDLVRSVFRETILGTPGVASVPICRVELDNPTRKLTVTWQAVLFDGSVIDV